MVSIQRAMGKIEMNNDAPEIKSEIEDAKQDLREALGEDAALRMHRNDPNPDCPVGHNVRAALEHVYCDANTAINQRLRRWTLQDMFDEVNSLSAQSKKR